MRLYAYLKTDWSPAPDWYPLQGVDYCRFYGISQSAGFSEYPVYMYMFLPLTIFRGTRHLWL